MVDSDMNILRNDIMENFPHIQWYVLYSINTAYDFNIKQQYYQQFNIFAVL